MSAPLLRLTSEIRNQIYDLLLVMQTPISSITRTQEIIRLLTSYHPSEERFTYPTALFYVNRKIHHEATSFFYASNRFDLCESSAEEAAAFLTSIGPQNAAFIRHIEIDLPHSPIAGLDLVPSDKPNSRHLLPIIRTHCPHLRTLTMRMERFWTLKMKWRALNLHPNVQMDWLKVVDNDLRLLPSLREIVVVVFTDDLNDPMVKEMRERGWIVNATEFKPEFDEDECDWDIYD